jgi:tetratricopeptide (TPR) repeat protein
VENGLSVDSHNADAYLLLGELCALKNNKAKALSSLKMARKYNPQLASVYYHLANLHIEAGSEEAANENIEMALRLNPTSARSRLLLGDIYLARQNYPAAIMEYLEASTLDPALAEAPFRSGEVHYLLEQFHEAMLCYRQALRINPDFAEPIHRLGNIYFRLGRLDIAKAQYEAALQVNPQLQVGHFDLADVLAVLGNDFEAIKEYRLALGLAGIECYAGDRFFEQGNHPQAIAAYRLALKMDSPARVIEGAQKPNLEMGLTHQDRRKYPRLLIKLPVDVRWGETLYSSGRTLNVSSGGLLIESNQLIKVGSEVEVITPLTFDKHRTAFKAKNLRMEELRDLNLYRFGLEVLPSDINLRGWNDYLENLLNPQDYGKP